MKAFLGENITVLLFLVIAIGYVLSQLKYKGIGLGVAFVLFTGLAFGAWGNEVFVTRENLQKMELVAQIGLILFVYTIGLQAGPTFFQIIRRKGLYISLWVLVTFLFCGALTLFNYRYLGIDAVTAVGVFCGALTNTPALAAATEYLKGSSLTAHLTIGYSVAYPLGVILPIAVAQMVARWRHVNYQKELKKAEKAVGAYTEVPYAVNVLVDRKECEGQRLGQLIPKTVIVSRVQRSGQIFIPHADTVVAAGDILHLVGARNAVQSVVKKIGHVYKEGGPELDRSNIDFRRIMLTNSHLVGRELQALGLEKWGAVVTRIRRGDNDFVPTPTTRLERGDRLRVVAPADKMKQISKYLGDEFRSIAETDYFSFALGILLGLIIGNIPITIGDMQLKLGLAGGPLVSSLVLGYVGRTGNIYWAMPLNTNLTLRQLGLVMFFTVVGIKAGGSFMGALQDNGLTILLGGILVTATATLLMMLGSMLFLKMDWVSATGILSGAQTQPAILSYLGELVHSETPNTTYAAVMPVAMIVKILMAQILLWMLL